MFAPRCEDHVGLEDNYVFGTQTTPDTDEAFTPPVVVGGTTTTFEDGLWDWLNVGAGVRFDIRRLDTDEAGTAFSGC